MGIPPQELMRGWGRPPILKDSIPNHGLRIHATRKLIEERKKGSVVGRGRPAEKCKDESRNSWVQGRTERGTVSSYHRK